MDQSDKQAIESVFSRLEQVSRQGAPRDPQAEDYIGQRLAQMPGSAYYLAQTVVIQEQALQAAQARIDALEQELRQPAPAPAGGLVSRMFGGSPAAQPSSSRIPQVGRSPAGTAPQSRPSPFGSRTQAAPEPRGGGFLAGAAQTAMGVAGGMMLGNLLGSLFAGGAQAAPAPEPAPEDPAMDEPQQDEFGADFSDDSEW